MVGQRCQREGCRAWARHGWAYCQSHGQQRLRAAEAAPEGNGAEPTPAGVAWVQGQWMVGELAALEDLLRSLMTGERAEVLASMIGAARLVLVRLLREEEDPVRLTEGLKRAAEVVFKAIELEGDQAEAADSLAAASTRILTELGLGPPEASVLRREYRTEG